MNLVANAIKFTHEGEVSLWAEKISHPNAVRIHVRDTGIGIKEENIAQLFQEFRQLDSSPTREYGGTGLGLSICKMIVELHGGDIQVKSTVGVGSTFIITLPLEAKFSNELPPAPKVIVNGNGKGKIVLSIDDDPEVLTLLADSLQGTGYTFMGAQSGEEGLALARQIHPHAITLDIMMPHMDGWSVLQTLKNDPELKAIPVFIISILENKALAFSLGVTDYIVKPFDRQGLLNKLKNCDKPSPRKILVVDDDPAVAQFFEEALKTEGYTVDVAHSRQGIFDKLDSAKPDVLFLDIMMPQVSGFEVLDKIEKDPALKDLRVFVMTAKHLTPDEIRYLENRVEVIVQKGSRDIGEVLRLLKEKLSIVKEEAVQ